MWDCAIIGGGPAGLTAATYLGRFKRNVVMVDAGESRLKRVPLSRNVPGFADGVSGLELHQRMHDQAARYGAVFRAGRIERIERSDGGFLLQCGEAEIEASTVLLASGAKLVEPELPDTEAALARGFIRYCPICDGYEVQGKRIAVLGGRPGAIAEAHFLRTYSPRIGYFWREAGKPTEDERTAAGALGIAVAAGPLTALRIDRGVELTSDGVTQAFDVLYPSLGGGPQSSLACAVGARTSPDGGVKVDARQETRAAGFFAAGDVLQGLDQIASACGQAAIAAVAIHNRLRGGQDTSRLNCRP
jgi:thioredoxin reductase (NADPH)